MIDKKSRFAFAFVVSAALASLAIAKEEPTTAPTTSPAGVVAVSDKAALEANKDKDVTVEGTVQEAAWSASGKVMNVKFEGTDESKFGAVVFVKNRDKIDQAFGGDATKAWTGAKVQIKGKIKEYGGKDASRKGEPQMIITEGTQVTIVTPAPAK